MRTRSPLQTQMPMPRQNRRKAGTELTQIAMERPSTRERLSLRAATAQREPALHTGMHLGLIDLP